MAGRNGMGPGESGPLTGRGRGFCAGGGFSGKGAGRFTGMASLLCGAGYGLYRMLRHRGWCNPGFQRGMNSTDADRDALRNEAEMLKERLKFIEAEIENGNETKDGK